MDKTNHKKQIMIVEDDVEILAILQESLELEGYHTLTAKNGKEALDKLASTTQNPDLILLDLMMPIMNGWEFAENIKKDSKLSKIPIIVVSAFLENLNGLECNDFVEKPISINTLLDRTEFLLNNSGLSR